LKYLIRLEITIVVILVIAAIVFVLPSFTEARFVLNNQSSQAVRLTAFWRDQHKKLGEIVPGAQQEFSVDDEAGMHFSAEFADGSSITSEPIYFTSGVTILVDISATQIHMTYSH